MKKVLLAALLVAPLFFGSCGSEIESDAEQWAGETCSCLMDAGFKSMVKSQGDIQDAAGPDLFECLTKKADPHIEFMEDLNDEDKKAYIKALSKALIDTDCIDFALDQMMPQINAVIENSDALLDNAGRFMGPSKDEEAEYEEEYR